MREVKRSPGFFKLRDRRSSERRRDWIEIEHLNAVFR